MGNILRSTHQEQPLENEIISVTSYSDPINIGDFEGGFASQITWINGSSVNMKLSLEVSLDKQNWVQLPNSEIVINAITDTHIYDVTDTCVEFLRVKIEVISGIATFTIKMNGKARV